MEYCEKCKKEVYYFILKKVKNNFKKPLKVYTTDDLFKSLNKFSFGGNSFFLIDGCYYKNLGMPIE